MDFGGDSWEELVPTRACQSAILLFLVWVLGLDRVLKYTVLLLLAAGCAKMQNAKKMRPMRIGNLEKSEVLGWYSKSLMTSLTRHYNLH